MTRPLDDLLGDLNALIDFAATNPGPVDQARLAFIPPLIRECRAALATAREDGAREREAEIVAWLEPQGLAGAIAAHFIASGKYRQEKNP